MRWPCTCHESSRLRSISKFFVRRSERHVTNMRINYYPVQERPPEREQLRAGAHSDYGAFTILKGENAPGGLQVLRRGGDWADVPIIEDGFVINIGDTLEIVSGGHFKATRHRVFKPPVDQLHEERLSLVLFNSSVGELRMAPAKGE